MILQQVMQFIDITIIDALEQLLINSWFEASRDAMIVSFNALDSSIVNEELWESLARFGGPAGSRWRRISTARDTKMLQ